MAQEVKYVGGVGEVRARLLEREVGVKTIGDLMMRFPTATSTAHASGR